MLKGAMAACVVLLCTGIIKSGASHIATLLIYGVLGYLAWLVFKRKELVAAKPILYAVIPYMVVSVLQELTLIISGDFYEKWKSYFDNAGGFAILWVLAMAYINSRQKKALEKEKKKTQQFEKEIKITEAVKAELEVEVKERTAALTLQKEELQKTVDELKTTQAQLIQSEKMASLGELTAGIAHEIQNPLNFVNNFSELNKELLAEMRDEIEKGNFDDVKAIAGDVINNEDKINHHGKRADAIVKGMLLHSRKSTGQKESTEINALADEYLRLSYHGLRAKDKTFNAEIKTDFDDTVGKINIVPQDIGRVLLNLFNNAFYAVGERQKVEGEGYMAIVSVATKKINGKTEIIVEDNGNGIPQKIIDKIFQPFFTTKPTGQGTGLGLSLSYDIVKAHGGEIRVEAKEGEGTQFIVFLPINNT
jgi:C4-dicarboxylate-specific signal transduction histidine kinase